MVGEEGSLVLRPGDLTGPARSLLARLDRLIGGRHWIAVVVGLTFAASVFTAWPTYTTYHPSDEDWTAIRWQAAHPFSQPWGPDVHAFDSTYRMTPPLVGRLLGLEPDGYLAFQAAAGLGLFAAVAYLADRVTGDRRIATLVTVSVGLMWAGATAFVEVRPNFDAVALALLAVAMASRRPPVVVLCGFLAGWTDERAIVAMGFVALFHHVVESRRLDVRRALAEPRVVASIAAVALVVLTREVARTRYHLMELTDFGGLSTIPEQANIWPIGAWTGLEGFWIFVVLGTAALVRSRNRLLAGAYSAAVLTVSLLSVAVVDVTRSMAYLLPAGLVGLALIHRLATPKLVRNAVYAAFALTLAWPLYYAGGRRTVYWQYPLPVWIVGRLVGAT